MDDHEDLVCTPHITALMSGASDGMIAVAPDRTVRAINERASEMFGLEPQACIGAPLGDLGIPRLADALDAAITDNVTASVHYQREESDYTCVVTPYHDGTGLGAVITVRDDTEILRVRRRSDAILTSTSDGIIVFDTDDRITFINPAAERMLGRGAETVVGLVTDTWTLFGVDAPERAMEHRLESCMREIELEVPEHRIVDVRVDPVLDAREAFIGSIATIHDVTAEREAMRMKNEFVSTVSHELRTPLTSIKGYIDLILDGDAGEINEIQAEFLGIVKESSDRLVELINDMLDISRIESGRIVLKIEPLDIGDRIASAAATFRAVLDQSGRTIHIDVPSDLPKAAGDADRIGQVLINFISNAIKYSPEGGDVYITASAAGPMVRVGIRDEGIGIAPEDQERLFSKFYRVDSSLTREIGGTGLGLSICKSIIDIHGGGVGVESEPGYGSTFWFTLPVARPTHVRTPELEGPLGTAGGRVLVVDNSEDVVKLISTYLTGHGYEVVTALDADTAWRIALETKPQVITLDVMVGEGEGFDLLRRLKADQRTRNIPVVVLSIICDEGKSQRLGAAKYLEKPIEKGKLLGMIDGLVGSVASPVVLVVDDDRAITELLSRTLKKRGYAVMTAYDGREAMAAVARTRPHAILLDVRMPVMDGFEVLQALKDDRATADIPVVIMSAHRFEGSEAQILELADQQVCKPFDAGEFVNRIESVLAGKEEE
jgi:PAS domain S-box-containing protein